MQLLLKFPRKMLAIYIVINMIHIVLCLTSEEEKRDRVSLQKFLDDKRLGGIKGTRGEPSQQLLPVQCKSQCDNIPQSVLNGFMQTPFYPNTKRWIVLDLGKHRAVGMVSLSLDTQEDRFMMKGSEKRLPLHRAFAIKLINDEKFDDSNPKGHITVSSRDTDCSRTDTQSGSGPLFTTDSDVFRLGERRMRVLSYVFYNAGKQMKSTHFYYKHNLARAIKIKPKSDIGIFSILVSITWVDKANLMKWTQEIQENKSEGANAAKGQSITGSIGEIVEKRTSSTGESHNINSKQCIGALFDGVISSSSNYNARGPLAVTFGQAVTKNSYVISGLHGDLCAVRFWYSKRQPEDMDQLKVGNSWSTVVFFRKLTSDNDEVQKVPISSADMRKLSSRHLLDIRADNSVGYSVKFLVEVKGKSARLYVEEMVLQTGCSDAAEHGSMHEFSHVVMRSMCTGYKGRPAAQVNTNRLAYDAMDLNSFGVDEKMNLDESIDDLLNNSEDNHFLGLDERNKADNESNSSNLYRGKPRMSSGLRPRGSTAGVIPTGQTSVLLATLAAILGIVN